MAADGAAYTAPPRGTRPRNRRALIISAATDLFHRFGYERVAMTDIAEAVNVSAAALYRHFASKPQVLTAAVIEEMRPFREILDDAEAEVGVGSVGDVLARLCTAALANPRLGVLWLREVRNLPAAERDALREEMRASLAMYARLVRAGRPDLGSTEAELLAYCVASALTSVRTSSSEIATAAQAGTLRAVCEQIVALAPVELGRPVPVPDARLAPVARRERILAAAVELFARRGYAAVSVDDIGASVGMAGPSVYHHFPSKEAMLAGILIRGDEWLRYELHRTLALASGAEDAVVGLIRSYVMFTREHYEFVEVLLTDVRHLGKESRERIRNAQQDYLAEWIHLMCAADPTVSPAAARIRLRAFLAIANDSARTRRVRDRPDALDVVQRIGATILLP